MSGSLFEALCPACAAEMVPAAGGHRSCSACGRLYLDRFGYLVPVEQPIESQTDTDPLEHRPIIDGARHT